LTREHVYPRWAAKAAREAPKPGFINTQDVRHQRRSGADWRSKALNITITRTCEGCNTGWMSKLEMRCKPVLAPLIRGEPQTIASGRDQAALAAWAFKTAITFEYSLPGGRTFIPEVHRRYLLQHQRPPPDCEIWLGRYEPARSEETFTEGYGENWEVSLLTDAPSPHGKGYAVTFSIGYLVCHVTGFVGPSGFNLRMSQQVAGRPVIDFLVQLWPPQFGQVSWPPMIPFTRAGMEALAQPRERS
jgi:hypothetical protein